jgi:hypothetical protein
MWSASALFYVVVQLGMVLATIAFIHQNIPTSVSRVAGADQRMKLNVMQPAWLRLKRPWSKEYPNGMVVHAVQQRGKKVQRDWHLNEEQDSAAGDTGLLQNAYAEIKSLKTMMEQMRHSTAPGEHQEKKKMPKSRRRKREVEGLD